MTDRRLPHGYSNQSWVDNAQVVKQYSGIDASVRQRTEVEALARVAGVVPVPKIIEVDPDRHRVVLTVMPGRHGQELIDEGYASLVLRAAGRTLRRLHDALPGMVHGDFGPQNLLLEPSSFQVSAVLDWEFAHDGEPIEDLAWAEWIVRMHHPAATAALPFLFEGYGSCPAWSVRHAAMLQKCVELERLCQLRGQDAAAAMWRSRTEATRAWHE